ncbi:MAG: alpha/beta hydrolase-fold protein [Myxococcales bacterium]
MTAAYRVDLQAPPESAGGPTLLFLHGAGEIGTDLGNVRLHGPWLRGHDGRPRNQLAASSLSKLRVIAPLLEERAFWDPARLTLTLERNLDAATTQVCLAGLSLGGRGILDLALEHPDRFAALLCFCPAGGKTLAGAIEALSDIPIWFVHRENDYIVPAVHSAVLYEALRRHGRAWRTVLPARVEDAHDCWTEIFAHPATYDWLRNPIMPPPEEAIRNGA